MRNPWMCVYLLVCPWAPFVHMCCLQPGSVPPPGAFSWIHTAASGARRRPALQQGQGTVNPHWKDEQMRNCP
eukprot:1506398-Pyramimonas_sp.AAC.1